MQSMDAGLEPFSEVRITLFKLYLNKISVTQMNNLTSAGCAGIIYEFSNSSYTSEKGLSVLSTFL